jgi:hypothetical protein
MTRNNDIVELALATLGDATKIEKILSLSRSPRWPRQVQKWLMCVTGAGIIALNTLPMYTNLKQGSQLFVN